MRFLKEVRAGRAARSRSRAARELQRRRVRLAGPDSMGSAPPLTFRTAGPAAAALRVRSCLESRRGAAAKSAQARPTEAQG